MMAGWRFDLSSFVVVTEADILVEMVVPTFSVVLVVSALSVESVVTALAMGVVVVVSAPVVD